MFATDDIVSTEKMKSFESSALSVVKRSPEKETMA